MTTPGYPGLPLPPDLLQSRHWVAEIVYFPLETELLRRARALGCRTLDGGGMAVFQAVGAFELFTGIAPNAHRMLAHFAALQDAAAHAGAAGTRGIARAGADAGAGAGRAAVPLGR
ncbi:probable shikimate 5-dehydrogenase (partial sequence c terminus) protein [Ralstonia solanacearum IPO1609]|uniref:Probable shikimate 5-dehydrogenase (Partial sequence c terminus) protein n=1 Tax=Ralstonia solanacearum IPO1609 TaxID=564066 RepID=A0A7U7JDE0_RALSL|nr:probable shikimate 5-dehydrogenase (partial sequence c terminus) protein [Ralstonia solanacearum IPO1609]